MGAWLWVGSERIHLMELPNPGPLTGRPARRGRRRHTCIVIHNVSKPKSILDEAGIPYTLGRSGRLAIFTRDLTQMLLKLLKWMADIIFNVHSV